MKIKDGLKLKGQPAMIPDCGRDDLVEFFQEMGFKRGVEVGVFEGAFTEVLAKGGFEVYGVDPWLVYEDYGTPTYQNKANRIYERAKERLAKYPNVTLIKKMSMDAVKDFEDESIDFVYIDGNHQFRYIADDMYEWHKKLKKGGVLSGHDFAYFKSRSPCGGCQVREVVEAWAKSFHLEYWVLGEYRVKDGEKRDHYRSWMFIKGDEREPKP